MHYCLISFARHLFLPLVLALYNWLERIIYSGLLCCQHCTVRARDFTSNTFYSNFGLITDRLEDCNGRRNYLLILFSLLLFIIIIFHSIFLQFSRSRCASNCVSIHLPVELGCLGTAKPYSTSCHNPLAKYNEADCWLNGVNMGLPSSISLTDTGALTTTTQK